MEKNNKDIINEILNDYNGLIGWLNNIRDELRKILEIILVNFIILKALNIITWPWLIVSIPIYIGVFNGLIIFIIKKRYMANFLKKYDINAK
jgi:hypothetical protein